MFRIDDPSAVAVLPTPDAAGTEGYFTEGNPGVSPATLVRAAFLNMVQEELRAVVVAGGQTPSKTTYNQLLSAINALIAPAGLPQFAGSKTTSGYQKLPGGLIVQWGAATGSTATLVATLPIAFPNALIGRVVSVQDKSAGVLNLPVYANQALASATQIGAIMNGYDSGVWSFGYIAIGY